MVRLLRSIATALLVVFPLLGLMVLGLDSCVKQRRLDTFPADLRAVETVYEQETGVLIGPGGNGTILRVVQLEPFASAAVAEGGLRYLERLQDRRYDTWYETPVDTRNSDWSPYVEPEPSAMAARLADHFSGSYDAPTLPEDISARLDGIMNSEGSFYAFDSRAMIVVAPEERLAFITFMK
jgi:hypothetical protein